LTASSGVSALRPLLTIAEVARALRCSRTHLCNILAGKVRGLPPLPVLRLGRRLLIRYDALMLWVLSLDSREADGQRLSGLFGK
jgi:hypothetical protein